MSSASAKIETGECWEDQYPSSTQNVFRMADPLCRTKRFLPHMKHSISELFPMALVYPLTGVFVCLWAQLQDSTWMESKGKGQGGSIRGYMPRGMGSRTHKSSPQKVFIWGSISRKQRMATKGPQGTEWTTYKNCLLPTQSEWLVGRKYEKCSQKVEEHITPSPRQVMRQARLGWQIWMKKKASVLWKNLPAWAVTGCFPVSRCDLETGWTSVWGRELRGICLGWKDVCIVLFVYFETGSHSVYLAGIDLAL